MLPASAWHRRLLERRDRQRAGAAWGSSLLVHLAAAGVCIFAPRVWFAAPVEQVSLASRSGTIVIQGSWSTPVPEVIVQPPQTLPAVEALPMDARREERTALQPVEVAARRFDIVETMESARINVGESELERREAVRPHVEPPIADARRTELARRQPAAAELPPPTPVATLPGVSGARSQQAASFADNPPPNYPTLALRNRWSGTVFVRVWIDETGAVTQAELERSSGHSILDAAALDAVRRWRARPAKRDGHPVATVEIQQVNFLPQPS